MINEIRMYHYARKYLIENIEYLEKQVEKDGGLSYNKKILKDLIRDYKADLEEIEKFLRVEDPEF